MKQKTTLWIYFPVPGIIFKGLPVVHSKASQSSIIRFLAGFSIRFYLLLSIFQLPIFTKNINFRKLLIPFKNLLDIFKELVFLTHFWQMLLFYTPRKTPENRWFSVFSRGYKNGALSWNSVSNVDQKFTKKCYYDFGRHYDQLFDTSKQQNFKVFWGLNFLRSVFSFPEEKINRIKFILVLSRL